MSNTFFPLSVLTQTKAPEQLLPKCGWCGFYKKCQSKKMQPSGKGKRRVLIVGEFPSESDDRSGKHFTGKEGAYLRQKLQSAGLNPDRDCVFTNALICKPPNKITDNEVVSYCRPNILRTIEEYSPETIVLLGPMAVKSVIGYLWREDVGKIDRWVGFKIPVQKFNAWVCPTYGLKYLLRRDNRMLDRLFYDQLREALELKGRPWKDVPDYKSRVQIEFDADKAAEVIERMARGVSPVAFDYETNMLKPDHEKAQIVCCSVSDGKTTMCFPWVSETIAAMRRLFRSKVPKIASNMKFEERWTRAKLGIGIRNWDVDTMLASHVLDNRAMINSIKFQSFVLLGQESYDDHIKPYLKSKESGGYSMNRIRELDPTDLMLYCGLDSLLEWKVAKLQRKELRGDTE